MSIVKPPQPPTVHVSIGVTGHRAAHADYARNTGAIKAAIDAIFETIDRTAQNTPSEFKDGSQASMRLNTLLVDGTDQAAAELALARKWELVSPLPFGRQLNLAINALPLDAEDARALLGNKKASDEATRARVDAINVIADSALLFELADQDEHITALYLDKLDSPDDFAKAQAFAVESAQRAMLAGRVMIEQSDLIIAVWDGKSTSNNGGTGHTVACALEMGAPVIWIDPASPDKWSILYAPESLAGSKVGGEHEDRNLEIASIIADIICPDHAKLSKASATQPGISAFIDEKWHDRSARLTHGYRRIEALFGNTKKPFRSLIQAYERPEDVANGSGAALLKVAQNLPNADLKLAKQIDAVAMQNFAWADGIAARLSDHYRGGMIVNFILSAFAIVGGILYLPLVSPEQKWIFALFEFLLLLAIVIITIRGQKNRWHGRWFETRRVAEYFRHGPLLLMLGVARARGRWPQGTETSWPEWYVRQALRSIGLPQVKLTSAYLRLSLTALINSHVTPQRDYHFGKAKRLKAVHHNLDRFSELLFGLAVLSVASYLLLKGCAELDLIDYAIVGSLSKTFTVLGVMFPTFGAGIAGIRYFGDFERFAAISEVTAKKLDAIHHRINLLLAAPDTAIDYGKVTALVHATDDVVVSEIENWQAVFGGKQITVPV